MMGRFIGYADKVFDLGALIPQIRDSRVYPQIPTAAVWTGTFVLFATRLGSLNAAESELRIPKRLDGLVGPDKPSADTMGRVYTQIDPDSQRQIIRDIHLRSRRNKAQQNAWPLRFLAVDGHELFASRHRCCPGCTQRTIQTKHGEVVEYYHRGVMAHLVGFDLALPLDFELQGPGEGEVPAAIRMFERLASSCPRYFDVVVADSLYFQAPFINACLDHGKHVLVVVKGEHRVLMQEAQALRDQVEPEVWDLPDRTVCVWDIEGFTCCEDIRAPLRVVWAEETIRVRERVGGQWVTHEEQHTWVWATTAPRSLLPTRALWKAGHARWDVEDDAFNPLGTHWGLDHCFKHEPVAIENFILTLLVAFVLLQHFYLRNCKPSLRWRLSLIAMARELHAALASGTVRAPWPVPAAGVPP